MIYVVINAETLKFVARFGSWHSYTPKLQDARAFKSREDAERDCCGNERVLSVVEAMQVEGVL